MAFSIHGYKWQDGEEEEKQWEKSRKEDLTC